VPGSKIKTDSIRTTYCVKVKMISSGLIHIYNMTLMTAANDAQPENAEQQSNLQNSCMFEK